VDHLHDLNLNRLSFLEVVIFLTYIQMSKNQRDHQMWSADEWFPESPLSSIQKIGRCVLRILWR